MKLLQILKTIGVNQLNNFPIIVSSMNDAYILPYRQLARWGFLDLDVTHEKAFDMFKVVVSLTDVSENMLSNWRARGMTPPVIVDAEPVAIAPVDVPITIAERPTLPDTIRIAWNEARGAAGNDYAVISEENGILKVNIGTGKNIYPLRVLRSDVINGVYTFRKADAA